MIFGKQLVPVILALGLAAGCSTAPKEPMKDDSAEVTQAIDAAKSAIAKAKSLDWIWRDTESFLAEAEKEAAAGNSEAAIKLANKARNQADLAVNQYYLEKAKVMYGALSKLSGLSAEQQGTLSAANAAIRDAQGRKAYDLLTPLMTELSTASIQYEVVRGDSLWSIAGKQETYNNPYQWPLIYKSNRDQIKDADLIYPGQDFDINTNPSAAESEMAINHAKNRGAWSIGVVEESDRNYLGGSLDLQ
jgi:nucleoid-associated protein YgaU